MRAAVGLVAVVVAARLWLAGQVELAADEAYYWTWSRWLAAGYFDHPPAIAWIVRAGTAVLGDTELGVRFVPGLLGAATGILAAWAAAVSADSSDPPAWTPLFTAAALLSMPLFALGGVLATPDVPLAAAWALGLLAFARGNWVLVGIASGLAVLSKYTGAILLPLLALAEPAALRTRGPWIALAIGIAVSSPNVAWNLAHDGVSWRFQIDHVTSGGSPLLFLAAQVGLVGPVLFLAMAAWGFRGWRGDRVERAGWWTSVPLLAVAAASGGEPNWAAPAWIGAAVGLARAGGRWRRAGWAGLAVSAGLSVIGAVHLVHPFLRIPADPFDAVRGGRTLAESVAAWGIPVVYTSRYQEAAWIHFYARIPAHALPGEGRPDQYDLWPIEWADRALFVRPWRSNDDVLITRTGYERGAPNVVTAWTHTADPLVDRIVQRWQVYEAWRREPKREPMPSEAP